MKRAVEISALIIFALVFISPQTAFPAVKISLKNGRKIIADECRDSGTKLICEKMGGTFEIGKRELLNYEEMSFRRLVPSKPEEAATANENLPSETDTDPAAEADSSDPGKIRLEEINRLKKELIPVREGLILESKALDAERKAYGEKVKRDVFDSFQRRFDEIDVRIDSFNKEIRELVEEEQAILQNMKGASESVK